MDLIIKGALTIETEKGCRIHPRIIELLCEIEQTGSLNAAVRNIGMSYSYAWNIIFKTNCQLECPIIITKRGGNGGGIAELTNDGRNLLRHYKNFECDFNRFLKDHKVNLELGNQ